MGEDGDGEAEQEVLLKGEVGGEVDLAVVVAGPGDGLDDGHVLLVDVDEAQVLRAGGVVAPVALGGDGEGQVGVLVGDLGRGGVEGQDAKGLAELDVVDIGARAGHDEVLVQGVEGDLTGRGGQEGVGRGDLAEQVAVEAVLLAFLSDDGADTTYQAIVAVQAKVSLDIWQRAEDDVGECGGERDGGHEIRDWGHICAGQDGRVEDLQRAVGIQGVQLFLGLHGGDGVDHGLSLLLVLELVAFDVIGHVEEKLGEERHLPKLVECNEPQ